MSDAAVSPGERRERGVLIAVFAALLLTSWALVAALAPSAAAHDNAATFGLLAWIWLVMMTAMMLPVVLPWAVVFSGAARGRGGGTSLPLTGLFVGGYLAVWAGFSLLAAGVQLAARQAAWLDSHGAVVGPVAMLLVGVFQWTPAKDACLEHCRSPVAYFMRRWRDGPRGALRMGLAHGAFCLGCCWALMLLPLALGVMSVPWMAALTALIMIENLTPIGVAVSRLAGLALMLGGAALLLSRAL